ncbi:hypothetical protein JW766_02600 [Candidatus Dojkabacteria bacterium]|nr:hypothetical protein [Candidatus Dojkabacteria bacterium]
MSLQRRQFRCYYGEKKKKPILLYIILFVALVFIVTRLVSSRKTSDSQASENEENSKGNIKIEERNASVEVENIEEEFSIDSFYDSIKGDFSQYNMNIEDCTFSWRGKSGLMNVSGKCFTVQGNSGLDRIEQACMDYLREFDFKINSENTQASDGGSSIQGFGSDEAVCLLETSSSSFKVSCGMSD